MKTKLFTLAAALLLTVTSLLAQVELTKLQTISKPESEQFFSPDGKLMAGCNRGIIGLYDVTDINNPVFINGIKIHPDAYPRTAVFYDNYLFVGTGMPYDGLENYYTRHHYALYLYDISNPLQPVVKDELINFFPFSAENLWVYNDMLILHYGLSFRFYSLSPPTSHAKLSDYTYHDTDFYNNRETALLHGDYIYVHHDGAVKIFDISDIQNPYEMGRVRYINEIFHEFGFYNYYDPIAQIDQNYLIAGGDRFIHKINVTVPTNPVKTASLPVANDVEVMLVNGRYVYVPYDKNKGDSESGMGFYIYDAYGEDDFVLADSVEITHPVKGLNKIGNTLIATYSGSYYTYDISNPAMPQFINRNYFSDFNWFYTQDDLFIGSRGSGLVYEDYNDFANFNALQYQANAISDFQGYIIADNYLYGSVKSGGVAIYDVTDKMHPARVDTVTTDTQILKEEIALSANAKMLFGFSSGGKLAAYDVSDKHNPQFLRDYRIEADGFDLIVMEDILLINTRSELWIYEINESEKTLTELAAYEQPNPYGRFLWAENGIAYVDRGSYVYKVDVTDKNNITETITELSAPLNTENTKAIVKNNYSFIVRENRLYTYYYNPENNGFSHLEEKRFDEEGYGNEVDMQIVDNYLFLETGGGYAVYYLDFVTDIDDEPQEKQIPSEFELSQNYPNPFNPRTRINFTLPNAGWAELTIHDPLGRKVETLLSGETTAGTHQVTFNAEGYPSGVYIYTLRYNTLQKGLISKSVKMLLLK